MESNFDNIAMLSNILGWKHGVHPNVVDWTGHGWDHRRPQSSKKLAQLVTPELKHEYSQGNIRYLILVKNPYSYYVSNIRRWTNKFGNCRYARQCIRTWNTLYENWTEIPKSHKWAAIVRFEDLITDKECELANIASLLGLNHEDNIVDTKKYFRALNETTNHATRFVKNKQFDSAFYTSKKYMSFISEEVRGHINAELNKELLSEFSYELETG